MRRPLIVSVLVAGVAAGALLWVYGPRPGAPSAPPREAVVGATPAWAGQGLGATPAAPVIQLDRTPGVYTLPDTNRGADDAAESTWTLGPFRPAGKADAAKDDGHEHGTAGGRRVWHGVKLPFDVPPRERRFAPEGMEVRVDGEVVPFFGGSLDGAERMWRISGSRLEISGAPVDEAVVTYTGWKSGLAALEWGQARAAGLTAEAFVRRSVAFEGSNVAVESREGLFLPAPGSATFAGITVPDSATFSAWVGLAPSPLPSRSDGARVQLVWTDSTGETRELGAHDVDARGKGAAWKVDLAPLAGRTGTLTIRTEPGATPVDDHVFLGSPTIAGAPTDEVRRIVVIGIDTLRPDHMGLYGYGRDTTPELDAWARDHAVVFDNAWTSAPRTRPSFRSATTGREPIEAVCAPNIGAVFDAHGFATAGIVANVHLNPRFDFHQGFDWWRLDGEAKAPEQLELASRWLAENAGRDSYLFLHIMDPHIFYVAPPPYDTKFTSELPPLSEEEKLKDRFNRGDMYRRMQRTGVTDLQKQHVVARYDGEVAALSARLGPFLESLADLPGRTVVVIHSDHGEEFWEHGGFEHNHTLYDDVVRGVLIIAPPGGPGVRDARSPVSATLQDIAPTLYELAGITDAPPTDGESLVPALAGAAANPDRPIPVGHLQYEAERWGVVWRQHKYILFTGSGQQELYDLVADPREQTNLVGRVDPAPWWKVLGEAHRRPVGLGWRVKVDLADCQVAEITLPRPATDAGLLDPESVTNTPVNQEWGEVPPLLPEEVAEVELLDGGRRVRVVGGPRGRGLIYVLFGDEAVDPAGATATIDGKPVTLFAEGGARGTAPLDVRPGVVIVPPAPEVERMASCLDTRAGSADEMAALEALGYVQEGPKAKKRAKVPPATERCPAR